MALKPFNSVGGFSVGETPSNVILANGDVSTTKINSGSAALTVTANSNVTTFQANGQINIPATLVAVGNITAPYFIGNVVGNITGNTVAPGANTQILFNLDGNTAANANLTFNKDTSVFTVTGNANVSNLNVTTKVVASTLESNVATGTAPFVVASTTKVANLNVDTVDGFDTSQTATANTIAVRNADGNITANYFIGNGSQLTGVGSAGSISNGTSNVSIPVSSGNVNTSVGGVANVLVVTTTGANIAGTLNATGNANTGNFGTTGLIVATGNVTGGNLNTGGVLSVTGNANIGNIGAAAGVFTGVLSTTSTLSVTGNANVGNIGATNANVTAITATGNANVGNLGTAGLIVATGNVTGGNLNTGGIVSATGNISGGNLTTAGVLTVSGTGVSSIAGNLDMTSNNIINLATPVNASDAATKQYVDDVAQGLHTHDACYAATANTLAIRTGGTITYNNGSSGVGANLVLSGSPTANYIAANCFDGNTTAIVGSRILVKSEANAAHNGIYVVDSATVLTRATDFDTPTEMAGGDFTFVQNGDNYNDTGWVMTDPVTTVGTSPVNWVQFSGAGTYTAGTGLTLTGTVFSVNTAQPTITSVGTLTSLTVSGNASAGNISTAGVLSVTGNANVGNIGATNANVTAITATGNANVGNLGTGGLIVATGNITGGNLVTAGVLSVTGNGNLGNVGAARGVFTTIVGTLETAAQPNITSVGTLSSLTVSGNLSAGNLSGVLANGTSNVSIPASGGNVNISSGGTANVIVVTTTGANITGYANITGNVTSGNLNGGNLVVANFLQGTLTTAAQPNITSVGSLTSLTVTGNANVGNLGTAGLVVATGNVTGGNLVTGGALSVTGNANVGNIGAAAGVFTGNITATGANSVIFGNSHTASGAMSGNLNVATVTGNLGLRALASTYTDNVAAAGTVANAGVHALGTPTLVASNAITTTNAATFFIQGAPTASTNVTITNGYALHVGSGNSLFAATVVAGNLSTGGTLSVTGNANVGNLGTAGLITATGNITGGNLIGNHANGTSNVNIPTAGGNVNISVGGVANVLVTTTTGVNVAGTLNATGNANVGNIGATNANVTAITATGNANVGNLGTGGLITATGNVTGGNLVTSGQANITGNVIAGNVYANTGTIGSNIANIASRIDLGNTDIGWATLTTTAVTANQTIAQFAVSGVTGVEYLVKGIDSTGSKYSVATVSAVTDGSQVDYATYATAGLGTTTGVLSVNISGSNIALQVTPASTNSTVWTTQYRVL